MLFFNIYTLIKNKNSKNVCFLIINFTYLDFRLSPITLFIILPSKVDALHLNIDREELNKLLKSKHDVE